MSRPPENQPPSDRPSDPFELWRQIYETNERAWNAVLERTVNNPSFAESSSKVLETFLSAQKTVRENMRQYLEQINLPTREDIARLGELIVGLEEKIDQLDDRLARLERLLPPTGGPAAANAGSAASAASESAATTRGAARGGKSSSSSTASREPGASA
jgi:BMFP domain-containing protein YqiC